MWAPSDPIPRITTASGARGWRARDGRYRLVGTVCAACGRCYFPPRRICPTCHARDLPERVLPKTGTVTCAAEDHTPLVGHGGRAVRPFAIVALDGGPSVLAELVDTEAVTPGARVEAVVRKWRRESNGLYQYGYKFRPRDPV
jgi:scaffold protein (connect acetoacetyl-CoA thiolase and HMG-CoA synthase)